MAGVERSEPPEIEALGARYAGPQPLEAKFFNGLLGRRRLGRPCAPAHLYAGGEPDTPLLGYW